VLIGELGAARARCRTRIPGIEQVCYLLEGEAHVEVAGEKFEMKAGEACFFPADAQHLFIATTRSGQVMVIYAPPYGEDPRR
jgi:quercetin dioxygenase-like cupin family protein